MERVCAGHAVLVVWRGAGTASLERLAGEVRTRSGRAPQLEHAERLRAASLAAGSWDAAVVLEGEDAGPADELLAEVLRVLKPRGVLVLPPPPPPPRAPPADLALRLKLNGFVEVARVKDYLVAEKPNFEVGSRSALRGAVWRLAPEDEVEAAWGAAAPHDAPLVDAELLLDADDIKRPDAATLRVCASTGARKACADCSCGLAEELRGAAPAAAASSCGSCYLGDAFRCSTCPYLGTPAFRPGERVLLADLRADI